MRDLKIIALIIAGLVPILFATGLASVIGNKFGYWAYSIYCFAVFGVGVLALFNLGHASTIKALREWVNGPDGEEPDQ